MTRLSALGPQEPCRGGAAGVWPEDVPGPGIRVGGRPRVPGKPDAGGGCLSQKTAFLPRNRYPRACGHWTRLGEPWSGPQQGFRFRKASPFPFPSPRSATNCPPGPGHHASKPARARMSCGGQSRLPSLPGKTNAASGLRGLGARIFPHSV